MDVSVVVDPVDVDIPFPPPPHAQHAVLAVWPFAANMFA